MNFLEFCRKTATDIDVKISYDRNVPEQYDNPMRVIVNNIKCRLDKLDSYEFPYIESVFDDKFEAILDKNGEEDVPDSVINTLSVALFDKLFNDLEDADSKSIIKVLSVYLLISIIRRKTL